MTRPIDLIDADTAKVREEERAYEAETSRQKREIENHRCDGLGEIKRRLAALRTERTAAQDAAAQPHEWEGCKVTRDEVKYHSWGARERSRTPLFGIVETVTSKTEFPRNSASWRRPSIGQPIVRFLKKDGSAGLKFEDLRRGENREQWKLA